eukprot:m51a1_g3794 hypothetical protein (250) ;mRNA; r:191300-192193
MVSAENEQYLPKLKELTVLDVDAQCKAFLRAFVLDFQGHFETVLDQAEEFKKFADGKPEMEEHPAHIFLEKRGEAHTVVALREKLKQIDIDCNGRMSFVEYALFKHSKTLKEMFNPPAGAPPRHLLEALDRAIDQYQSVLRQRTEQAARIAELEATVAAGGKDAPRAKAELMRLKMQDPAQSGADEISAAAAKLKAKAALKNAGTSAEEAYREEQERLAAEKKRKEEEEARKREESRQRLRDRAKAFGQ